jgi:CheY-like chemotaxis protein
METMPPLTARTQHRPLALIVDRDGDTRKMYAEYLALSKWLIEEAEDGREALAKAITRQPDVIVTETRLPGIDGFELCTLLRRDDATRTIPIVVVTGDAFESDVTRAQHAGADVVLVKPCLPETLLAEIHRVLHEPAALRDRARHTRVKVTEQLARSEALLERSTEHYRRVMLSRAHQRRDTTEPPAAPPALVCPSCDVPLRYQRSHIGGVSERHSEQWDYYECSTACGTYQYRQRTRKLRKV